jgi:hypothetical protein
MPSTTGSTCFEVAGVRGEEDQNLLGLWRSDEGRWRRGDTSTSPEPWMEPASMLPSNSEKICPVGLAPNADVGEDVEAATMGQTDAAFHARQIRAAALGQFR